MARVHDESFADFSNRNDHMAKFLFANSEHLPDFETFSRLDERDKTVLRIWFYGNRVKAETLDWLRVTFKTHDFLVTGGLAEKGITTRIFVDLFNPCWPWEQ